MIKKKSNSFLSCDRKTSVNVVIWCPDETEYDEPVAVLQICHGMIEYIDRYDGFARYMAERGFVVVGMIILDTESQYARMMIWDF